jgi:hypothetical protein
MTYSQGGLIQATDYNTFAQGGAAVSHNTANINTVWGVGSGNKGYGQSTTLSTVTGGSDTVTATQWATLIARIDSILSHQAGSGSGLTQPSAGNTITFLSTLSTSVTNGFNNRLNFASNGSDVAAAGSSATAINTGSQSITRTATFASADQARYFFNAGGKLIWNLSASNTSGNAKGTAWVALVANLGSIIIGQATNSRTGSGGTVNSSNTALGYWNAGTSNATILRVYGANGVGDYNSNDIQVFIKTNGVQGSNGDVGQIVTIVLTFTDTAADNFDDSINFSVTSTLTVRPPSTSNLSNVWGGVTTG